MSLRNLYTILASLVIATAAIAYPAGSFATETIEVLTLLNEGVIIRYDGMAILVDGLVEPRLRGEEALTAQTHSDLLRGRPPFSSIQVALVTHPHAEHFHAPTAGVFLKHHPETVLAATRNILEAIRSEYPQYREVKKRLKEVKTRRGRLSSRSIDGIKVEFVPFAHEASAFYPLEVIGHIIHLGERQVLYVGDAEMSPENWEPYDLKSRGIDLVLVPFWLYKEEITQAIIDEYVAPDKVAVVQIPPQGMRHRVKEIAIQFPDVVFLSESMMSVEF